MSGFNYTTTNLLADIKRKAFVPTSQITFDDLGLLDMADEEMQIGLVPFIMTAREEYLVNYKDYLVDGTTRTLEMPKRAIGAKLRAVTVLLNMGTSPLLPNERRLPEINSEDAVFNNTFSNYLSLQSFFLRENNVILSPGVQSFIGQTIRMYYFQRPNKLIQTSACSQVTSILGNQVTVNLIPTNFIQGQTNSIVIDLVKAEPPFKLLSTELTVIVDSTNNTITFPDDVSTYNLTIGDYICLAGESPIPMIPVELQSLLAQRVAVKILASLGDEKNFQIATDRLKEMEHNAKGLLANRVEGSNRKVINQFGPMNLNPFRRF